MKDLIFSLILVMYQLIGFFCMYFMTLLFFNYSAFENFEVFKKTNVFFFIIFFLLLSLLSY